MTDPVPSGGALFRFLVAGQLPAVIKFRVDGPEGVMGQHPVFDGKQIVGLLSNTDIFNAIEL